MSCLPCKYFRRLIYSPLLETSSLFLHVLLIHDDTREPISSVHNRGRELTPMAGARTAFVNCTSSLDPPGILGVFAFNDLSVRKEGLYRLQFYLFEIIGINV